MDFIPAGTILGDKIENRKNVDGEQMNTPWEDIKLDDYNWVSDSPYLHAFDRLDEVHFQMEEQELKKTIGQIVFEVIFFSLKWNDDNNIEINADFRVSYKKYGATSSIHSIVASKGFQSDKQQIADYKKGVKNKSWMLNRSNMRFIVDNGYI